MTQTTTQPNPRDDKQPQHRPISRYRYRHRQHITCLPSLQASNQAKRQSEGKAEKRVRNTRQGKKKKKRKKRKKQEKKKKQQK
jgi:hypothetical protein